MSAMAVGVLLQPSYKLGVINDRIWDKPLRASKRKISQHSPGISLSSCFARQGVWGLHVSGSIYRRKYHMPHRYNAYICGSIAVPTFAHDIPFLKSATFGLTRSFNFLRGSPLLRGFAPAVGIIVFAVWGLGPVLRYGRNIFHKNDNNWKKSRTHFIFTSYLQPILLWTGATLICRTLDPLVLTSEASQVVKQRLLNFAKSLSTVLVSAYCLSSFIQQMQKFFMEKIRSDDTRNMGFQFAGRAVYSAVWIAAFSLFMELLGFSTQKWVTAGGLGTVLLTLAGREIFTNFLSSIMIHATRPFILNEWIQTKIEGSEVSGTVEHVGWWSPTIIRGDDREAVHIPNHKFTVSVVRNLSQKTHWRIKTHLAISHLDVNKINNIVADMRKVLAKNPQIEQQRLHRRVFLDNINPENQALLILISCFVKTSHFEEYLCVKEAVLLDLLRVISHHRARLATPIRTVQKIYGDVGMENIPFAETIFNRPDTANRPLLLIEPSPRINGEEKAKLRPAGKANEDQGIKSSAVSDHKATSGSDGPAEKPQPKKATSGEALPRSGKTESSKSSAKSSADKSPSVPESANEQADGGTPAVSKNEGERSPFEDNIVLEVAIDGLKRTLPVEVVVQPPAIAEGKEVGAARGGSGGPASATVKDRKGEGPVKDR